ncbi:hypothetical protein E4T66_17070 [Sinimarinibacterium sp. CAU 1509]|uniref:hypothetical protein n=1 Tax=Sinimarinibacterium sp. CAU 1509 TaxID=2562283 RepID=UPI0010AD8A5E|nr:hypothetical protein [Sinimarinibacterium sp. CAU 1509]TJY58396.1 hypothetical protein E4T66_17070 [Sinimarinibacterium sp. CAU 1509]
MSLDKNVVEFQYRSARVELACLWSFPVAMALVFGGVWLAGMFPPLSPSSSSMEVQEFFRDSPNKIRAGMILSMLGCAVAGLFVAVISTQMKRVEGAFSPLAYTQLLAGLISNMLGVLPFAFIQIGAFRADRMPEILQLLYDSSWLMNLGIIFPTVLEISVIGACAFMDRSERIFPRWYAWICTWVAFVMCADVLVFFFKAGPFAFNGIISFWLELSVFAIWLLITFLILRKSINKSIAEMSTIDSSGAHFSSSVIS